MITYFDDHYTITPQFFYKVEKICEKYIVREAVDCRLKDIITLVNALKEVAVNSYRKEGFLNKTLY